MEKNTLTRLDDAERIHTSDPENMYSRIFDLPQQMTEALEIAKGWDIPVDDFSGVTGIVVVGMGGSAIGGDLVRTLSGSELLIPFQVCRHYRLPEYVNDKTLVIASSYSGNTEETLAALDDALGRKAMIVAITTGGMLGEIAKLKDIPTARIPAGLQPRAAIGYSFIPILILLEKLGLFKNKAAQVTQTVAHLQSLRDGYSIAEPSEKNPAKQLALQMHGKIPIIYSGPTLTDVIGIRWKGQICENAKNMAFANNYSEFNHNELVGWSDTIAAHKDHFVVIHLKDAGDHPKITRRMQIVRDIIEKQKVPVYEVESIGNNPLERMFSLIQLGDFVSFYLAILNEVDPTPVEAIETLKKALADHR